MCTEEYKLLALDIISSVFHARSACTTAQFKQREIQNGQLLESNESSSACTQLRTMLQSMSDALSYQMNNCIQQCLGLMLDFSSQGPPDLAAVLPHHFICHSCNEMYSCHSSACSYVPLDACLASSLSQNCCGSLMLCLFCNRQFAFLQAHNLAMANRRNKHKGIKHKLQK